MDAVAALQFSMKQKIAFFYYHSAIASLDAYETLAGGTPPALPQYTGSWINELSQIHVNLLLHAKVPVFCLHEYIKSVDFGPNVQQERRQQRDSYSFLTGLDISYSQPFDRLQSPYAKFLPMLDTVSAPAPDLRTMSGSWVQGYIRRPDEIFFQPDSPNPSDDDRGLNIPSVGQGSTCEFDNLVKQVGSISIVPPPIRVANAGGKWTFWTNHNATVDVEAGGKMRRIGERQFNSLLQQVASHLWFDREYKRSLCLENSPAKHGFGNEEWGQPFPDHLEFPPNTTSSCWIYKTQEPGPHWKELVYGQCASSNGVTSIKGPVPTSSLERSHRSANRGGWNQKHGREHRGPASGSKLLAYDSKVPASELRPPKSGWRSGWGAPASAWDAPASQDASSFGWGMPASAPGWGAPASGWGSGLDTPASGWDTPASGWDTLASGWDTPASQNVSLSGWGTPISSSGLEGPASGWGTPAPGWGTPTSGHASSLTTTVEVVADPSPPSALSNPPTASDVNRYIEPLVSESRAENEKGKRTVTLLTDQDVDTGLRGSPIGAVDGHWTSPERSDGDPVAQMAPIDRVDSGHVAGSSTSLYVYSCIGLVSLYSRIQ